jgi:hypothetical protein
VDYYPKFGTPCPFFCQVLQRIRFQAIQGIFIFSNSFFLFALDHINYARWLPIHLRDMLALQKKHPEIYAEFDKGNYSSIVLLMGLVNGNVGKLAISLSNSKVSFIKFCIYFRVFFL